MSTQVQPNETSLAELRFRALVDAVAQGVWHWDPHTGDGDYRQLQQWWCDLTGQPPTEQTIAGNTGWLEVVHPDDRETIRTAWLTPLKAGEKIEAEYRVRAVDGQWRTILARMAPVVDDQGKVIEHVGILEDITERKQTEQALRASELRLDAVLDSIGDHLASYDKEWRYTYVNDKAAQVLGKTRDELLGKSIWELFPSAEGNQYYQEVHEAAETGRVIRSEHYYEPWDVWYENYIYPSEEGVTVFSADVTWRKKAQRALNDVNAELERRVTERTAELEAAHREMEGFTYTISHDLRTPLRAIIASCMMLTEDFGEQLNSDAKAVLDRQVKAASKLAQLIDDLLHLTRIARLELHRSQVDLSATAEGLFETLVPLDRRDSYEFTVQPGLIVSGDPTLLRLLVQNLLENAIKFSPKGGEIEFGQSDGCFYLRDQGIGFDMQYAHKVFTPFERLVRDDEFSGTGIGLANVKRIVERHNGKVWAESAPGQGATFFFTLGV